MKVLHVIPSFHPSFYGGPPQSTYQLCCQLVLKGCEIRVLTTNDNGPNRLLNVKTDKELMIEGGLRVRYCKRYISRGISPRLLSKLPTYIHWADIVHLTAVYSFSTIPTLLLCKALDKPVVWTPRGSFQQWEGASKPRFKNWWNLLCQLIAPQQLTIHVTSEAEEKATKEKLHGLGETIIITNAVQVPDHITRIEKKGLVRLLYIGRLHCKKGIENLLLACKRLNTTSKLPWLLSIAGAGDIHYTETLQAKIAELGLSQQVKMLGEVVGNEKQALFENADLAVFPSYVENFGMVVAEALAHGVPVIASKGTPWSRVEEIGCGVWIDNDPDSLGKAIEQMSQMPLRHMGQRGRQWMQKEFSWNERAEKMKRVYESLCQIK